MNRAIALLWGFLTLLPPVVVGSVMWRMMSVDFPPDSTDDGFESFERIWRIGMASNGLILLLLVSYVVYLFKTNHVPKDKKALWAVVLFLGHVISMPIFWYVYVWSPLRKRVGEDVA